MSDEDKARSVMCRVGQPGNRVAGFTPEELAELAAVYEACREDDSQLASLVGEFWGRRQVRLDALKAADDAPTGKLFRNRKEDTAG